MESKADIIDSIIISLYKNDIISEEKIQQAKQDITVSLHDYSLLPITSTEITESKDIRDRELISYYIKRKKICNIADNSISQVLLVVKQLMSVIDKPLDSVEKDDIEDFLFIYQKKSNCKFSTMDNKRRLLMSFFGCISDCGKILKNPMIGVHAIKCESKLKTPLSDIEIEKIKSGCEDVRDLALIYFLLETGVRVQECSLLNVGDIDFVNKKCKVFGKGKKEREVYFSGKSYYWLKKYLDMRESIDDSDPLFVTKRTYKTNNKRLAISGIQNALRKIGRRCGVVRLHPHLLRATFATRLAQSGTPINVIAKILGHANLNTVNRYVILSMDFIEREVRKVAV